MNQEDTYLSLTSLAALGAAFGLLFGKWIEEYMDGDSAAIPIFQHVPKKTMFEFCLYFLTSNLYTFILRICHAYFVKTPSFK